MSRKMQEIAECERKTCHETWVVTEKTRPVVIAFSDGRTAELDLCFVHEQRLVTDWAPSLVTSGEPIAIPTPAVIKNSATDDDGLIRPTDAGPVRRRRAPRKGRRSKASVKRKFSCLESGCNKSYDALSSLRSHLPSHGWSLEKVSTEVSKVYGKRRPMKRVPCPDGCGETITAVGMKSHRDKHARAAEAS